MIYAAGCLIFIIGVRLGVLVGRDRTTKGFVKALCGCELTTGQVLDMYAGRAKLIDLLDKNGMDK